MRVWQLLSANATLTLAHGRQVTFGVGAYVPGAIATPRASSGAAAIPVQRLRLWGVLP